MQDIRGVDLNHGDPILIGGYGRCLQIGWLFHNPGRYPVVFKQYVLIGMLFKFDKSRLAELKSKYKGKAYSCFGSYFVTRTDHSCLKRDFDFKDTIDAGNLGFAEEVNMDELFYQCIMPFLEGQISSDEMQSAAKDIVKNYITAI